MFIYPDTLMVDSNLLLQVRLVKSTSSSPPNQTPFHLTKAIPTQPRSHARQLDAPLSRGPIEIAATHLRDLEKITLVPAAGICPDHVGRPRETEF